MKRFLFAAAFAAASYATICASAWSATLQFPKSGAVTFTIQVPAGWTSSDDGKGNLTLSPPQNLPLSVSLAVLDNANAVSQMSVAQFAQAVLTPSNATAIYKQTPGNISGVDGTTFYSSSQNGDGTKVDLKLTILTVNARYIVMEIVVTPTVMTPALETSLKSLTKGIALKVTK